MSTMSFRKSSLFRYIAYTILIAFVGLLPAQPSYAQVAIVMPPPGQMIHITNSFEPPQMVGLKIDLKNPFSFGFIMDRGESPMLGAVKKEEFNKIIKYFLVSLAMPNKDMWVNLSPYESKRIIPEIFAQTEMGRDLLSQDYVLKEFTASLMYPEDGLGKKFWDKIYQEAQARFGTTDINVNTFNKVWIVADHADVYQKGDTAFLVDSHLKVMLEQDFMAIEQNKEQFGDVNALNDESSDAKTQMASQVVREIIIPAIEKEVNEGKSFAAVRQIYNAEILATWFKKTLRASLLGQVFADKSKIAGQRVSDPQAKEKIYQQYLKAYERGVFNFIRREATPDGQIIPRRYLSGGMLPVAVNDNTVQNVTDRDIQEAKRSVQDMEEHLPQGRPEAEQFIANQLEIPGVTNRNLGEEVQKIADQSTMGEADRAELISNLVRDSLPHPDSVQVSGLQRELNAVLGSGRSVLDVLDNHFPGSDSMPIRPETVAKEITTAPLSHNDQALLVSSLIESPRVAAAEQFGRQAEILAGPEQRLDLAMASFAPATEQPPSTVEPADIVQDHLATMIPEVTGLQDQLTAYQGPQNDVEAVQQSRDNIQRTIENLREQQASLAEQLRNGAAAGPSVLPRINEMMPQVRSLQANLTALQNRVTDTNLQGAIRSVASNLETTMAGLQQQRDVLSQPAYVVQDHLATMMPGVTGLRDQLRGYQGSQNDVEAVQQSRDNIESTLENLKEQQENLAEQLRNGAAAGPSVLPRINEMMPQVRSLQANLTALQNRVTDTNLQGAIRSVASNLETTMAGLQQQRDRLTAQPVDVVQDHLATMIPEVTGLQDQLTAYQGPQNDVEAVQQSRDNIQRTIENLREQQASLAEQLRNGAAAGPSVLPRINEMMPQVRSLQANLTALQNRVTDTNLQGAIRSVASNLETTMAGLQQQRDVLSQPAYVVQDHLATMMPGVTGLRDQLRGYQGSQNDVEAVQQSRDNIESTLENLKEQQENLAEQLRNGAAAGPSVLPRINEMMPQVRSLQANLTALQNRVTDTNLQGAIRSVASNLETTMAGLQQQRDRLTAQPVDVVQDHLATMIPEVTGLQDQLTAYQGPQNDVEAVQQSRDNIQRTIENLREQQASLAEQLRNGAAAGPSVLPRINEMMPQVRSLQANLTALQNRVTDTNLQGAIRSVASNLETTMAGLQQQRDVLSQPAYVVQDHLATMMPGVTGLRDQLRGYQGSQNDVEAVQQSRDNIESTLENLKEQQENLAEQLRNGAAAGPSVLPRINEMMPQVRSLQANLTALQNRVTDTNLQGAIRSVASNLETTMAGLQQQRDRLTAQPADNTLLTNPGGINLNNEHLTMNIKVDGAGMPLAPQYQDKAMMNLNGLISIIRSITPITQQNVPALYELTK